MNYFDDYASKKNPCKLKKRKKKILINQQKRRKQNKMCATKKHITHKAEM